jgi:hypothetical protein
MPDTMYTTPSLDSGRPVTSPNTVRTVGNPYSADRADAFGDVVADTRAIEPEGSTSTDDSAASAEAKITIRWGVKLTSLICSPLLSLSHHIIKLLASITFLL